MNVLDWGKERPVSCLSELPGKRLAKIHSATANSQNADEWATLRASYTRIGAQHQEHMSWFNERMGTDDMSSSLQ
jgi:hypothetical protein